MPLRRPSPCSSSDAQSEPSVQTPRKPSPSGATPTLFTPAGVGPGGGALIGVSTARAVAANRAAATKEHWITPGITGLVAPPSAAAVWAATRRPPLGSTLSIDPQRDDDEPPAGRRGRPRWVRAAARAPVPAAEP